jgi:hypothetical protein
MIIDHLHDCKPALESCGLVSHAWLPASRFHLFRNIELRPNSSDSHCCDRLYEVIQQSPYIAAIIRELHIDGGIHDFWVHYTPCLALFLDSLTRLKTLHIKDVNWDEQTLKLKGALCRVFISNPISNFDFEECHIPFSSLLSVFNTRSASISLTLLSFNLEVSDHCVPRNWAGNGGSKSKCRFHELRIVRCSREVSCWLDDPESGPDLSHLRTLYCGLNVMLLLQLGGHLQHLCLCASSGPSCVSIPSLSVVLHSHPH